MDDLEELERTLRDRLDALSAPEIGEKAACATSGETSSSSRKV